MVTSLTRCLLVTAVLAAVGCSARGPAVGSYERRTIHLSAGGQEVNLPNDYGLSDAFPARLRIVDAHSYEAMTGESQGRGSYRLERDSIFFENEGRVVMAGRVIDNAIFVHVLGNPAAMSGGANTDVLIQFSKS
jgi:hypothetical protein